MANFIKIYNRTIDTNEIVLIRDAFIDRGDFDIVLQLKKIGKYTISIRMHKMGYNTDMSSDSANNKKVIKKVNNECERLSNYLIFGETDNKIFFGKIDLKKINE